MFCLNLFLGKDLLAYLPQGSFVLVVNIFSVSHLTSHKQCGDVEGHVHTALLMTPKAASLKREAA